MKMPKPAIVTKRSVRGGGTGGRSAKRGGHEGAGVLTGGTERGRTKNRAGAMSDSGLGWEANGVMRISVCEFWFGRGRARESLAPYYESCNEPPVRTRECGVSPRASGHW